MDESLHELSADERAAGLRVAAERSVAVFIVAYNAAPHIRATIERIPADLRERLAAIYVIDDHSKDATVAEARTLRAEIPRLSVFTTPYNQGYGGNQKLGYRYALDQGFDLVVLLHGDGQYPPELMARLLAPFADGSVDAVFGSRMLVPGAARRGGMPLYKRIGNRILTALENRIVGTRLSEFHSGYRAYRTRALRAIPFSDNTNGFHFDTEIVLQLHAAGRRIVEVPMPTHYGDEVCHVDGLDYALRCIGTALRYRANRVHLVYHPKFDVDDPHGPPGQEPKARVLLEHIARLPVTPGLVAIDLEPADGSAGRLLEERGVTVRDEDGEAPVDLVLALDRLEHEEHPERAILALHRLLVPGGRLVASTANVAYFVVRLALLLGQFNYGTKGILDMTHRRLFTIRAFRRLCEGAGFRVDRVRGYGPPIRERVGQGAFWRMLDALGHGLARVWPSLFAYQFVVEATRLDDVPDLLSRTVGGASRPDD